MIIDEATGLDARKLAAAEVYRDRMIADAEADGRRVVYVLEEPIGYAGSISFRAWDHSSDPATAPPIVDYIGPPDGLPAAIRSWCGIGTVLVDHHDIAVAAARRATDEVDAVDVEAVTARDTAA